MRAVLVFCLSTLPAMADSVVATRTIPARATVQAADVTLVSADIPGALTDARLAIGQEARVAIYAGRPINAASLTQAALVERNQIVRLRVSVGGLFIETEGRALSRAALGEAVRVMNLSSHAALTGRVADDGSVIIEPKG